MSKIAIVAALEHEVRGLTKGFARRQREHQGRTFIFFEREELVVVCGGIGAEPARRAAEAVITLYSPALIESVGFAGALTANLRIGDIIAPGVLIDARDGSRTEISGGDAQTKLVTFMAVAGVDQKKNLAQAYGAQAVDMEAAAVAAAARAHGIKFGTIKVISDELEFSMLDMERFVDAGGRFKTVAFAAFVALRPWLWRRVAQLAANSRKAEKALSEHIERGLRLLLQRPLPSHLAERSASSGSAHPAEASAGGRK
jgi:adenosylhomocysteine nucleosidase